MEPQAAGLAVGARCAVSRALFVMLVARWYFAGLRR